MSKPTMTPEIYEQKRNDLIKILDGILNTATGLSTTARSELTGTVEKLKRNSFEIVLVGEFQGGKSTTFDTLCDGREISPRGIGIKTSACKISVQATPIDCAECAHLRWKSDDELMLTMLDIVRNNLFDSPDDLAVFSQYDNQGNLILPSLSDDRVFQLAERAVFSEWDIYKSNRAAYMSEDVGRLDLLKIATLILRFYRSEELKTLRNIKKVSVEDLKSYVVFPNKWEERWLELEKSHWNFDELKFVFLGDVSCFIHSKNLERLGCVITDCPGLFAGPWDTAVARAAMQRADAILYLLGGQKSITAQDMRALTEINNSQQGHKVFFAINARAPRKLLLQSIRPADCAMINQLGFKLEQEESINVFNALLAYHAKSEKDDLTSKQIAVSLFTYLGLDPYDSADRDKVSLVANDKLKVCELSNFPELILKIETSIVTKRFESILVKGGTDIAGHTLDVLSGNLKLRGENASKKKAELTKEVEQARKRLADFQEFVRETTEHELGDKDAAEVVSNDYFQSVYANNVSNISDEITECAIEQVSSSKKLLSLIYAEIYTNSWEKIPEWIRKKLPSPNKSNTPDNVVKQMLSDSVQECLSKKIKMFQSGWLATVQQGASATFNFAYGRALDRISIQIQNKWVAEYETNMDFLSGLGINVKWDLTKVKVDLNPAMTSMDVYGAAGKLLLGKVFAALGAVIVGLLVGALVIVLGGAVAAGVAAILAIFTGGGAAVCLSDKVVSGVKRIIGPKINKQLEAEFMIQREGLKKIFKDDILDAIIIKELKDRCVQSLDAQKKEFEDRVKEQTELKEKSELEQRTIAIESAKIREEQIQPARQKVTDFYDQLKKYFT